MGFLDKDGLTYLWGKVKAALSCKQDKLSGSEGQIVGFDSNGDPVAQNAPSGGLTQEEADALYLSKNVTALTLTKLHLESETDTTTIDSDAGRAIRMSADAIQLEHSSGPGQVSIHNVADPSSNYDAVNKKYVDDLMGDVASLLDSINGEVV